MKKEEKKFKPLMVIELKKLLETMKPNALVQFETSNNTQYCVGYNEFDVPGSNALIVLRAANLPMRNILGDNPKTYESEMLDKEEKKGKKK